MRYFSALIVILIDFIAFLCSAQAGDRLALVIGNGNYQSVPALPNPPRDAADIAQAFERLNFRVTRLTNANAAEMRKAVIDFGRAAEGSEMAVVFYAGHGMEVGGENWLIPIDAELRSDTDAENEAVSLRSISLQASKARQLGLVILDACRNNPFAAKMRRSLAIRAVSRGLAPTEPADNVLVAYAARDGTTANDGEGRNSPFTTALLRNIEVPGLEISFLFRRVRDEVMSATKREQQPFVYGSLSKEEIYLKPPTPADGQAKAVATPPISSEAPINDDERVWQVIKTSDSPAVFDEFLKRYPKSIRTNEAQKRLLELKAKQAAPAAVAMTPPAVTETKRDSSDAKSPSNGTRAATKIYTSGDAARVTTLASKLGLRLPTFSISEAKDDVPKAARNFVGVWEGKVGKGEGRQKMLIINEARADGSVSGSYVYGPPAKGSWDFSDPAGFVSFSAKISDNVLRFNSGDHSYELSLSKANKMKLRLAKPAEKSKVAVIPFDPVWQQSSLSSEISDEPSLIKKRVRLRADQAPEPQRNRTRDVESPSVPGSGKIAGSMEDRYRACKKLVRGFRNRDACARNGGL